MTENVKHIAVLRDLLARYRGQIDNKGEYDSALIERASAAIAALQREAAGDGEQHSPEYEAALNELRNYPIETKFTAPRPTGTDETTFGHGLTKEPLAITTPASAEPGACEDCKWNPGLCEIHSCRFSDRCECIGFCKYGYAGQGATNPDARGGGEAVTWLVRNHATGSLELAEPNEKASNPEHWSDAFPVYTHPTPAALDAEKVRTMVRDAIVEEVLAHPDDAVVDGPDFADAVLARFDAARATTGARHE